LEYRFNGRDELAGITTHARNMVFDWGFACSGRFCAHIPAAHIHTRSGEARHAKHRIISPLLYRTDRADRARHVCRARPSGGNTVHNPRPANAHARCLITQIASGMPSSEMISACRFAPPTAPIAAAPPSPAPARQTHQPRRQHYMHLQLPDPILESMLHPLHEVPDATL
jgi:hypothetical protein